LGLLFDSLFVALEILIIILIEALKALKTRLILRGRKRMLFSSFNFLALIEYD